MGTTQINFNKLLNDLIDIQMECDELKKDYTGWPEEVKFNRWSDALNKAINILKQRRSNG